MINVDISDINVTNGKITFKVNLPYASYSLNSGLYIITGSYGNAKIFSIAFLYTFSLSEYMKASVNMGIDAFNMNSAGGATISSPDVLGSEEFNITCMALTCYKE